MRFALSFMVFMLAATSNFAQQRAPKAFHRDDLVLQAARFEQQLLKDFVNVKVTQKADELIKDAALLISKDEPRKALDLAQRAAIVAPNTSQPYRVIARAAMAIMPRDDNEKAALQNKALASAYVGYQKADTPSDESLSLSFLAQSYEARANYRQAINLFRLAIALETRPELIKRYEELRDKHGFRLLSNNVLTDQTTPSACFNFSENLKANLDYTAFVTITGVKSDFAVTSQNKQLCVEGLKHGERYSIIFKQGFPSSLDDEPLRKAQEHVVYVRDRKPTMRFTGRNYVLPSIGQLGIPLVSINAPKINLTLMRINDRNLVHSVQENEFLAQIEGYKQKNIIEEKGEKLWQGFVEVKADLNRETTTAIPLQDQMKDLKPGLYILTAKPFTEEKVSDGEEDYNEFATQWFIISDFGITSFNGNDGAHVLVKSLANATGISNATVRLIAKNNEVLGTVQTNAMGYAKFDEGLSKGKGGLAPSLVVVSSKDDYAFLDLKQTAFDFSSRGLKGRVTPDKLDAFITTERGVYRGGETVYISSLLRDAKSNAVAGLPLTLIIKRPDGVEQLRQVVNDQGQGGRSHAFALLRGASSGTWRVRIHLDPKLEAIGETTFLVEDYVPEKLDLSLSSTSPNLVAGKDGQVEMNVKHLYGAPASDLSLEGSITIKPSQGALPNLKGFEFGITDEKADTKTSEIEGLGKTDANGKAFATISTSPNLQSRPYEAEVVLSAGEAGGRFIARTITMPILPVNPVLAVKKNFKDGELQAGQAASFDLVYANLLGQMLAKDNVEWRLSKITRSYQWYYAEGKWNYESNKQSRRVADGKINLTANVSKISAPIEWGTYRLELLGKDTETAIVFNVGEELERSGDAPDMVDVTLDKSEINAGQKVKVNIASRFNGKATLALMGDKLQILREIDVTDKGTTVEVEVTAQWNTSNWLVVLTHRPLDIEAKRQPARAVGLAHIAVNKQARSIEVMIDAPATITPRQTLKVPVKVQAQAGEELYMTLAAVDVGILNLTRFQAPDPRNHYFGARLPGFETRDLYGFLIDGQQGQKGVLRQGGDGIASKGTDGDVPNTPPMTFFSGVVKVGEGGVVNHSITIPAFNGTLRLMAMVWSKERVGNASKDIVSRDAVVMQSSLPRFLSQGDETRLHVDLNNIDGISGEYTLNIAPSGGITMRPADTRRIVKLAKGEKLSVNIPFIAAGVGIAKFDIRLTAPNYEVSESLSLPINPANVLVTRRFIRNLEGEGGKITLTSDLVSDFVKGTTRVSLSISPQVLLDVPNLVSQLTLYPYGCTEQTVSGAMPMLYLSQLGLGRPLLSEEENKERVNGAISRVLARQASNGSFGLWSVPSNEEDGDLWLDSFVADFLIRAKEKGYIVPHIGLELVLNRLRNKLVNASDFTPNEANGLAYSAYVLARSGRAVMGDLRYMADTRINTFSSALARGQIGAALSMLGDKLRGKVTFENAIRLVQTTRDNDISRPDYGSLLRDSAGILTLVQETGGDADQISRLAKVIESSRGVRGTSTQENVWMVLAAQAFVRDTQAMSLVVNNEPMTGAFARTVSGDFLADQPLSVTNAARLPLKAALSITGVPLKPEPALSQGFTIERQIVNLRGEKVEATQLKLNQRYIVILRAFERQPRYGRVMISDPIPAGLEIENVKLTQGAGLEGYSWLNLNEKPVHFEVKDDRFQAAFDRAEGQSQQFSVAYMVRAGTPGKFADPATLVEDMYRPDRMARTGFGVMNIVP